jgi:hypothetical protein
MVINSMQKGACLMIRNVGMLVAVLLLGIALGAGGWLLGSQASVAQAAPTAVSAVATDWVTTFEQDPFDQNRVRRSTVAVTEVAIVWSDGRTELRDLRK